MIFKRMEKRTINPTNFTSVFVLSYWNNELQQLNSFFFFDEQEPPSCATFLLHISFVMTDERFFYLTQGIETKVINNSVQFFKLPSHRIGSAWKWYLWWAISKYIHRYMFCTFIAICFKKCILYSNFKRPFKFSNPQPWKRSNFYFVWEAGGGCYCRYGICYKQFMNGRECTFKKGIVDSRP